MRNPFFFSQLLITQKLFRLRYFRRKVIDFTFVEKIYAGDNPRIYLVYPLENTAGKGFLNRS